MNPIDALFRDRRAAGRPAFIPFLPAGDPDGPEAYHVVLLDNGRSAMLGTEFEEMLRCIRCGACMNHCPVYHAIGGHAYGWVYPGPMGAVLTPTLVGVDKGGHLPNASTFCGRCESVCPMRIPIPKMLRHWREREFTRALAPRGERSGIRFWAFFARRPALYHLGARIAARVLGFMAGKRGRLKSVPLAGGWTEFRDLPAQQRNAQRQQVEILLGSGAAPRCIILSGTDNLFAHAGSLVFFLAVKIKMPCRLYICGLERY